MFYPSQSQSVSQGDIEAVHQLLVGYSFEADAYDDTDDIQAVIATWLDTYGPVWVSHAITEALYQGRYKVVSIDQILQLWQRRGQPIRHFNREFESIILGQTLLCPTGYGDGVESADSPRAPLPQVPTPPPTGDLNEAIAPAASSAPDTPAVVNPFARDTEHDGPERDLPEHNRANLPEQVSGAAPDSEGDRPAAVPDFQPVSTLWPHGEIIRPFVPLHNSSDLHQRLRAVVQGAREP